jgi:predicted AAA+ superfamily ATPase
MIPRFFAHLERYLKQNRVLVIYGARRVGKTTLLESFLATTKFRYRLDSGDNIRIQELLSSLEFERLIEYAQGYDLIAIDEAQEIPNIGKALKILVDQLKGIRIIATGSSSFDLAQSMGEPLTGRKQTLTLYPFALMELLQRYNRYELKEQLENFLVFGFYPEVIEAQKREDKITLLSELVDSYLLKDLLAFNTIRSSKVLIDLLKLLAFQVGQMVSYHELATQLQVDVKTVARYLDLLEKTFVIFRLGGLSRNLRKEISSKHKYYFYDVGIRNGIIRHFNHLTLRNDLGPLWENFLIIERLKMTDYTSFYGNRYCWRTYQGSEIDYIEEQDSQLKAFEYKWSSGKRSDPPKEWTAAYPEASFQVITPENFLNFVLPPTED